MDQLSSPIFYPTHVPKCFPGFLILGWIENSKLLFSINFPWNKRLIFLLFFFLEKKYNLLQNKLRVFSNNVEYCICSVPHWSNSIS